ncbi:MAG: type I-A CRISPR-associated protein Csa5 [Desulfurococcales archaeon]|nr:type I-A CRISPR-associated protein Csa5 [Desulfurococcales archaeon]
MSVNTSIIDPDPVASILAVLIAENDEYSHVDKLGYVVSPDLAVYYLREALRDFSSLMNKTRWDNPLAYEEAKNIPMDRVDKAIEGLAEISDPKEVRRIVSMIAAKALAKANKLKTMVQKEGGEK